jgi:hypothetical protein
MNMKAQTMLLAGIGAAAALAGAAPAAAQTYDYRYDRDRDVIEEVVDGVARVAGAVAQVTRGGYYDPRYGSRSGYGYDRGGERFAADACAYEAQRRYARRYGGVGVDIRDVQYYRSNRLRVYGTLEIGDFASNRNGRYGRYDRYDPYGRSNRYGQFERRLGFTCTVRPDGRVTDFDTQRYY